MSLLENIRRVAKAVRDEIAKPEEDELDLPPPEQQPITEKTLRFLEEHQPLPRKARSEPSPPDPLPGSLAARYRSARG